MKKQLLTKGTIVKFMSEVPVRLLADTWVESGTDLAAFQDEKLNSPRVGWGPDKEEQE